MPARIFEDSLDLTIEQVETVPLPAEGPLPECYPMPLLRGTGRTSPQSTPVVVLENSFLRISVCPDLGGRILEVKDKRTGLDVLPRWSSLVPEPGGPRGLRLPAGLRILGGKPGAEARLNDMGRVDLMIRESEEEEAPAAVMLHELDSGSGVSWRALISLPSDRAEIQIDLKVLNRNLHPALFEAGLEIEGARGAFWGEETWGAWWTERDAGWHVGCDRRLTWEADGTALRAVSPASPLYPREVLSLCYRLTPFSGLGRAAILSPDLGAGMIGGRLRVQSSARVPAAAIILRTDQGSFSAQADLHPEAFFEADVSSLGALQAVGWQGEELAWGPQTQPEAPLPSPLRNSLLQEPKGSLVPGLAGPALVARSQRLASQGKWAEASLALEEALVVNGEDHLAWWAKAWATRMGKLAEERPELLNAHFLAPMEPSLRAESFLQQGALQGKDPSPITKSLARNPDAGLDVVHRILEHGEAREALSLIDEILRHEEIGLLRVISSWLLLTKSRMTVEAAQHIQKLDSRPLAPPFPWRPLEREAVLACHSAFPQSGNLALLAGIVRRLA